jgi:flagellar hook-length control protein FliK
VQEYRESERKKADPEKSAEKATAKDETGTKKVKGQSQREQAILKFMDSFEGEFGVPPTRIVEAMANLKLDEQAQSPEETADEVIGQLDLDDKDKDAAKSMYVGLLAQLGQLQKTPQAFKPDLALVTAGSQGRFAELQEHRGVLNQSLQNMNEKFWMKNPAAGTVKPSLGEDGKLGEEVDFAGAGFADNAGADLQRQINANPDFKIDPTKLSPDMQKALQAVKDANPTATPEVALAALVAAARSAKAKTAGTTDKEAVVEDADGSLDALKEAAGKRSAEPLLGPDTAAQDVVIGAEGANAGRERGFQSFQQRSGQQEGFLAKDAKSEIAAKDKVTGKSLKVSEFDGALRGAQGLGPAPLKDLGLPTAPAGLVANTGAGAIAAKNEEKADIRQIMNQAQYLIKNGGGEMKVEMTPEGMGKIHMKVLVENGKVNVQMSAETAEAKKAIEGGLSELKNSLAAHRLSMDHIKVDVVGNTNTDNTAQNQMNQNQNGREQSRQFWNHFSQDFGAPSQQRDGFADMQSLRGYVRPRTDKPLEPIRSAAASNYGAGVKGKGLNLVA